MNGEDKAILLVDDSREDLLLMRYAFRRAGIWQRVIELHNGQDAIEYFAGLGAYQDRRRYPLPCVIITDLKMPQVDGFVVLEWLQRQPELARVPRLVLSCSGEEQDRKRAAELGACGYFVKPAEVEELVEVVKHLNDTWIAEHCPTPSGRRAAAVVEAE